MERLARGAALAGGLVLILLVVLTCVSILGRSGNTFAHWDALKAAAPWVSDAMLAAGIGPVQGDFEVLESGIAFAIFAFLPICQLYGAHATVDVFTSFLPPRVNRAIITFWEVVFGAVMVLITARLYAGMESKINTGDTTFLLQFPVWWAYAASLVAAVVASIIAIYCALARIAGLLTGRAFLPESEGAAH